jgi:hypothetical protein
VGIPANSATDSGVMAAAIPEHTGRGRSEATLVQHTLAYSRYGLQPSVALSSSFHDQFPFHVGILC